MRSIKVDLTILETAVVVVIVVVVVAYFVEVAVVVDIVVTILTFEVVYLGFLWGQYRFIYCVCCY